MIDPVTLSLWLHRILFVGLAMALIFARLLPLGQEAGALPGPDLLLCLTLAWAMWRQDFVPMWLILFVFMAEDILVMRPFGLWTALVILAAEVVRMRAALMRELSFVMEWAVVSVLMLALIVVNRLFLALALVPQTSFGFTLVHLLWSIAFYPVVVLLSRYILDIYKPSMGEISAYGRRI